MEKHTPKTYKQVGKVTHYYDRIGVAVVELSDTLKVGDTIHFFRGGEDLFSQPVHSMQIEHNMVQEAGAGETVGLKVDHEVKNSTEVYKVTKE